MADEARFRRLLEEEKRRLEAGIRAFGERGLNRTLGDSISEFSLYDNHPADVGTETFEREKDFGLREDQMTTLDMVEDALERLDDGTYGTCVGCGRPIPDERLEAVPWTSRCVRCEEAVEEQEARDWRRPPEEDVRPAFSSFNDSDPSEPVEFDGEDAWQAVARYGTSNAPSDVPPARDYGETYVGAGDERGGADRMDLVPDSSFDPGRVGEEGTLSYEDERIVSSATGRGPAREGPGETGRTKRRGRRAAEKARKTRPEP